MSEEWKPRNYKANRTKKTRGLIRGKIIGVTKLWFDLDVDMTGNIRTIYLKEHHRTERMFAFLKKTMDEDKILNMVVYLRYGLLYFSNTAGHFAKLRQRAKMKRALALEKSLNEMRSELNPVRPRNARQGMLGGSGHIKTVGMITIKTKINQKDRNQRHRVDPHTQKWDE